MGKETGNEKGFRFLVSGIGLRDLGCVYLRAAGQRGTRSV